MALPAEIGRLHLSDTRRCFTGPTVSGESAIRIHEPLEGAMGCAVVVCGGNVGVVMIGSVIEFGIAIVAVVGVVMIVGKHGIGKDKWGTSDGWGSGGGSRASFGMIGGLSRCCNRWREGHQNRARSHRPNLLARHKARNHQSSVKASHKARGHWPNMLAQTTGKGGEQQLLFYN